jgi:retron-type reverse transcriptase
MWLKLHRAPSKNSLKPNGCQRELGILTVTDRLTRQALLNVLQQPNALSFSEHSHEFH